MLIIIVSFQVLVLKGGVFSSDNTDKDLTIDLSWLPVTLDPSSQRKTGLEVEFPCCRDNQFSIEKPCMTNFFHQKDSFVYSLVILCLIVTINTPRNQIRGGHGAESLKSHCQMSHKTRRMAYCEGIRKMHSTIRTIFKYGKKKNVG